VGVNGEPQADRLLSMFRPLPMVRALSGVLTFCAGVTVARADQVVVTDVTYTHSADTTSDSHYHVSPLAGTPSNWNSPVDYIKGSVHVLLEVKTKPVGDTPTKFQICFEGTPSYGCTTQSPTYTKAGTYEWTSTFSSSMGFYYGGDVDWSKGVNKIALILKDTMNNKPAGDPKYMPTDLHVEVTLLSQGASYKKAPPPAAGSAAPPVDAAPRPAAGSGGSAGAKAGAGGTTANAGRGAAGRDAGASGTDALVAPLPPDSGPAAGTSGAAGTSVTAGTSAAHDAGTSHDAAIENPDKDAGASGAAGDAGQGSKRSDSGCGVAQVRSADTRGWLLGVIGCAAWLRYRRRRAAIATP
jgi:hypothetical protein